MTGWTNDTAEVVNLFSSQRLPKLIAEMRHRRRSGLLSHEINIRYDQEMDEVIINCDEGRLRRPLLVVNDGKLALTRKNVEDIREGKSKWSDLIREGVLEWIDAEEEEDAYICVDPFEVPERCEKCGRALSPIDVDWMNPGTNDKQANLKCKHCNQIIAGKLLMQKDHTHMEVDPMVILAW